MLGFLAKRNVFHPFRVQLSSSLNTILSADFPEQWPDFVDQVHNCLTSSDHRVVFVGLLALREVIKIYQ